jgi:D-amino peptidase
LKVYIITDLEGVGGIVLREQVFASYPAYERSRHLLTHEVNACVQGAIDGGASEVIVLDGHGANSAYNLVFEELHEGARYVVGSPWPRYLPGLDESFAALFQLGAHAMSGTRGAILEHTMSSETWVEMRLNGRPMGEMGLIAAYAGHFGVPTALVTGDSAACEEARGMFGDIETAEVKKGLSRTCAEILPPKACRELIRDKAETALSRVKEMKPFVIPGPVEISIREHRSAAADRVKERPGVRIIDGQTVSYTGRDILEAWRIYTGG